MSAKEAKLELRVRGLQDPGRNPAYRSALGKSTSDEGLPHVPSTSNLTSSVVIGGNKDEIVNPNQFNVLETHDTKPEPAVSSSEECPGETLGKKRALDRTPPKSKKKKGH